MSNKVMRTPTSPSPILPWFRPSIHDGCSSSAMERRASTRDYVYKRMPGYLALKTKRLEKGLQAFNERKEVRLWPEVDAWHVARRDGRPDGSHAGKGNGGLPTTDGRRARVLATTNDE